MEQVLALRRPRGGRGRADGAQVGSVGGGESGRALEQLPLPLLGDLSREEGRGVALQPGAGRARLHGERGVGLGWRQLVGGRLELWALGWRQQAVVGQAAIPRRLIGQAFVAGVCGALRLERSQRVVCCVRRAQAGGAGATGGQDQGRWVGGVGAPGQGVARNPARNPCSCPAMASGALAPLPSPSARPYTSPHHRGPVQAAGLRAVAGLAAGLQDGGRRRVQTLPTDHLRRREEPQEDGRGEARETTELGEGEITTRMDCYEVLTETKRVVGRERMLDRCSIPSSHYWTGNIDWLEQALTPQVKDCVCINT